MKASIIIRTKNEERWIKHCLDAVYDQSFTDFEVILVDNESTDRTVEKAKQHPIKLVTISKYTPGFSLNEGVRAASGELLVFLSGHCIPCDRNWLKELVEAFTDEKIAGVYGRQLPMSFTSARDRRDLFITFGADERIQKKDSFFHNANSCIRKDLWDQFPFDEALTNIEDRVWAATIQRQGYLIKYTPESKVFHHHGIHHGGNEERAMKTVRVIENFERQFSSKVEGTIKKEDLNIVGFVPFKSSDSNPNAWEKLILSVKNALEVGSLSKVFILSDDAESKEKALQEFQNEKRVQFFERPQSLSKDFIDLSAVYRGCLELLEEQKNHIDLIVSLEPSGFYREPNFIENLIDELLEKGYDSAFPVTAEYHAAWIEGEEERIDQGDIPKSNKKPIYISRKDFVLIVYPEVLRKGNLYGAHSFRKLINTDYLYEHRKA